MWFFRTTQRTSLRSKWMKVWYPCYWGCTLNFPVYRTVLILSTMKWIILSPVMIRFVNCTTAPCKQWHYYGLNYQVPCGDGAFYVGKLLKKIAMSDSGCCSYIQKARQQLWPSVEENEKAKKMRENKEREERRRRAKERQVSSSCYM